MTRTLLVVDDIRSNREILKNILRNDYDVIEAAHGQEAVTIMEQNFKQISAVLLDLEMPVMDGFSVLEYLQQHEELAQIPVIVTTGQTDIESEVKALQLGANDYVSKPYNSTIIKQRIWNTINLRETAATVNELRHDRLTGLYNRSAFFEKVEEMVQAKEPGYYILSCFDIDSFKVVNDLYGTAAGDEVLKHVARAISNLVDAFEGITCRLTADNFATLYPRFLADSQSMRETHASILSPPTIDRQLSIKTGRYVVDDLSLAPSAMYDRAALAEASIKGRYDQYVAYYNESMRDKLLYEQEIVSEMEAALKDRQFEMWLQPQYNHSTSALIGAEALVRWRHPSKGLIAPAAFISIFEQNGFIYEVDKFVWEEACRFLRGWIDEGRNPLPISVNISRYDLFHKNLVDTVIGLVDKYEIGVEMLRLEITESAFAESTEQITAIVSRLVDHGFTVEIDDFGSGYSSLNTLKTVPAQVLKLDMRFLEEDDDESQRGGSIVESIVRMVKWLGMSVIAEGVETIAQADFLRSVGCSYVQGYLYARPMPVADYEALCIGIEKEEKLITLETVENLDSNSFWNPASMDSLIFNTYVGGACIYEYHEGDIELVRATEKFVQILGGEMTVDDALKIDWSQHLDADDKRRFSEIVASSVASKKEIVDEFCFVELPGCLHETYLRFTMRVIATAGKRCLVYCAAENMTAQREAERKEQQTASQLQNVLANVNCGITAVTFDGGEIQYLIANDRYFELLGYTRAEYQSEIGQNAFDTIVLEDRERIRKIVERVVATGIPENMEYRVVRRDGESAWIAGSVSMTRFEGVDKPVQISVYTDMTVEKRAAQDLLDN